MRLGLSPDTLYLECQSRKWDRLEPHTVTLLGKIHGVTIGFRKDGSYGDLRSGSILYGGWTPGGHCILVTEILSDGLRINDPIGYWDGKNYDFSRSGEGRIHRFSELHKPSGIDGTLWLHP